LQDTEAAALLTEIPETERRETWRLVRPHGTPVSHLGVRGRVPDALYRAVAERRGLLGRLVPDGAAPRRYP